MKKSILLLACMSIAILTMAQANSNDEETFTDSRDGKIYKTVKIGSQTWMAENLAYLPSVNLTKEGSNNKPYYYIYGYDGMNIAEAKATGNYATYGVLYNWVAAITACPDGWHLPNDVEWTELTNYLVNNNYGYENGDEIGKAMASTSDWKISEEAGQVGNDQESNNASGFTAVPSGYRYYYGSFYFLKSASYWWSSKEYSTDYAYARNISFDYGNVYRHYYYKKYGYSIRCIKDN